MASNKVKFAPMDLSILDGTQAGLYVQDGQVITTHSMLTTARRCMKLTQYKYAERLKPRYVVDRDKPLKRGTWMHTLFQEHYAGRSWKAAHQNLSDRFGELFDEEREALGDLPRECARIMRSYMWHYGADKDDPTHGWKVIDTEITMECPWPDGKGLYRCRLDFLAEDEYGLIIGDHKTNKSLPGIRQRLMDNASALYLWCAQENGFDVNRFVWNYIRTKAPSKPELAYKGTPRQRLSTRHIDTDYVTYALAIKEYGLKPAHHGERLRYYKSLRWQPGTVQLSPFFRREELTKDDDMIDRVVKSAMRTRDRIHSYDYSDPDAVERTTDRSCDWCRCNALCETELFGGNTALIRRQQFKVGDPLDYYQDQKDKDELA